jgi:hypothetical protein
MARIGDQIPVEQITKTIYKEVANKKLEYQRMRYLSKNSQKWGYKYATEIIVDSRLVSIFSFRNASINPILDIGCGEGGLWDYIKTQRQRIDIYGLDVMEQYIERAKSKHRDNGCRFETGEFLSKNFNGNRFFWVIGIGPLMLNMDQPDYPGVKSLQYAKSTIDKMVLLAECGVSIYFPNAENVPVPKQTIAKHMVFYTPEEIENMINHAAEKHGRTVAAISTRAYPDKNNLKTMTVARLL